MVSPPGYRGGHRGGEHRMASKDRPHREAKKKPKAATKPKIQPLLEAPPPVVEVIRPVRKPRIEEAPEEE